MTDLKEARRAGFEAWADTIGLSVTRASQGMMFANGRRVPAGGYVLIESVTAWMAYNAALDSALVEMPNIGDFIDLSGQGLNAKSYLVDLVDAIHAAGIKTT
jgi:hypothetical protein